MGNTVTTCLNQVITIHNEDGTILRQYKPPVVVEDILKESPDSYFVVSMSQGRTAILSSDITLHPGGKYYLLPPEHFFSGTSGIPNTPISDHLCSSCYRGCAGLSEAMASFSSKMHSIFTGNTGNTGFDWEKVGSNCFPWRSAHRESTGPDSKEKVGAIFIKTRKSLQAGKVPGSDWENVVSICIPWRSTRTGSSDSELRERVGSICIPFKCPQTGNTGSDWEKIMSSFCIPWKGPQAEDIRSGWHNLGSICIPCRSPKTVEDDLFSISREFSREKWLEDMIRGADNQLRRLKLGQAFLIEDAEMYDDFLEAKHWSFCLPSTSARTSADRESTASAKNEEKSDTPLAIDGRNALSTESMESSLEDISGQGALEYFQQLPQEDSHEGSRRTSADMQSRIDHEGSRRTSADMQSRIDHEGSRRRSADMQLMIEQMDRQDLERRDVRNGESSERLKIDETELRSLLRSSPSSPPMFLQKFSAIGTSPRWVTSLDVDRG